LKEHPRPATSPGARSIVIRRSTEGSPTHVQLVHAATSRSHSPVAALNTQIDSAWSNPFFNLNCIAPSLPDFPAPDFARRFALRQLAGAALLPRAAG
jgi:hypothetical protein